MSPPAKLPYRTYLDALEANVATLTDVLLVTPADVEVPSCPGWSLGDLAAHAGDFAAFYSNTVSDSTGKARPPWPNTWRASSASPLNGATPATYFGERARYLVSLLRSTAADAHVRTWAKDDQTAHFVARRAAHELAMHRVDAQLAGGDPQPIDAQLAADGIEEIFIVLRARSQQVGSVGHDAAGTGKTIHLRPTDQPTSWTISLHPTTVAVRRQAAAADLTVTATTSDLELVLYARPPVGTVNYLGDPIVLDTWYRAFSFI